MNFQTDHKLSKFGKKWAIILRHLGFWKKVVLSENIQKSYEKQIKFQKKYRKLYVKDCTTR